MSLFSEKHIFLNVKANNQQQVLKAIAFFAYHLGITTEINAIYQALIKREQEATTGFKAGFAIPHARGAAIKKPAILCLKLQQQVPWQALDQKPIQYLFAILVPTNATKLHLNLLAKLSTALLSEKFIQQIKQAPSKQLIYHLISNYLKGVCEQDYPKITPQKKITLSPKIVGVSACATGVVHTYMAKEALEKAGEKLNYQIQIETQGQKGQEFTLLAKQIKEADLVIIAADIKIDLERFFGKRMIQVSTNKAIDQPTTVITKGLANGIIYQPTQPRKVEQFSDQKRTKFAIFMQHMLSGVSKMIPFIVFSGIVWAIIHSLKVYHPPIANNPAFQYALKGSEVGFTLFIAIMGGFIADSIAGRAAIAPGMISTFVAADTNFYFFWSNSNGQGGIPHVINQKTPWHGLEQNVSLTLFAALIMGFAAGYLVKWINSWKVPKMAMAMMPILFIPIIATSLLVFPFIFFLSGPLGLIMNGFAFSLRYLGQINGVNFLIGCILGAMIGFDMGGPINKIAGVTATSLITIDPRLMGAVATAIPIAPLGCGLATLIFPKKFEQQEKALGVTALALGFFGISEGAIPFATKRPKITLIANVIGSGVGGGLAFLCYVGGFVGMWGGPITAFVLGVHSPEPKLVGNYIPLIFGGEGWLSFIAIFWFFITMAIGCGVHVCLHVALITKDSGGRFWPTCGQRNNPKILLKKGKGAYFLTNYPFWSPLLP